MALCDDDSPSNATSEEGATSDATSDAAAASCQHMLERLSRDDILDGVLQRFARRAVFANVHGDLQVGYESAALSRSKPVGHEGLTRSTRWYHLTERSTRGAHDHAPSPSSTLPTAEQEEEPATSAWLLRDHKLPLLLEILRRYHTLPWERTDVRFGSTHLPSPFAHEQIVGKLLRGAFEDPTARDVLEYMADRFVVDADGRRMGES